MSHYSFHIWRLSKSRAESGSLLYLQKVYNRIGQTREFCKIAALAAVCGLQWFLVTAILLVSALLSGITVVYLETQITDGGKSRLIERREMVTCHPETRDHRCDMRSGRCHGDHRSSSRCQILPGQLERTRHGIYVNVYVAHDIL